MQLAEQAGQWQSQQLQQRSGGGSAAEASFSFEIHERLLEVEVRDAACQVGSEGTRARVGRVRQLTESTQTPAVQREEASSQTQISVRSAAAATQTHRGSQCAYG